jgi:hypothetical protein
MVGILREKRRLAIRAREPDHPEDRDAQDREENELFSIHAKPPRAGRL